MIEPKIVINEIGIGSACKIITPHIIALFFIDMTLSAFFAAFILQRCFQRRYRAKPVSLIYYNTDRQRK